MADAEDVGVNGKRRLLERHGLNDICGLAPHPGQGGQFLQRLWHLPAEIAHKFFGKPLKMTSLVVGITDGTNISEYVVHTRCRHVGRRRIGCKQSGSHHVDALVGALRRKHHGYKKLKRIRIVEFSLGVIHGLAKIVKHMAEEFLLTHNLKNIFYGILFHLARKRPAATPRTPANKEAAT